MEQVDNVKAIADKLDALITEAVAAGVQFRVDIVSPKPLAMGNTIMVPVVYSKYTRT